MKIRNILKKTLAVVLAFSMCVPIMGNLEANVKEAKASEATSNVESDDSLHVKFQVTQGVVTETDIEAYKGKYVLRAVSAIQNPEAYDYIGFKAVRADEITAGMTDDDIDKLATPVKVKTVFKRINSTTGSAGDKQETYTYSPKVVDTNGEYFVTAKFVIAPEKQSVDYVIWAYGSKNSEKVTGPKRQVCVNDGLEECSTINMSFENTSDVDLTDVTNLTAKNDDKEYNADIIGVYGDTVNVRVDKKDVSDVSITLQSANKFEFYTTGENATLVGSEIFRNHTIEYNGNNADTSWYDVNPDANKFVIASSADLYGLANLVNDGTNFSGDTIIQVCDIEVNKGKADASGWIPSENETIHEWTQIGTSANMFSGIFDGDHNTISGVVDEDTTFESVSVSSGLFGYTAYGSLISNLKVANSNFTFSYTDSAAVVGHCSGSLENIYVDENVYVKLGVDTTNLPTGGIVGTYSNAGGESQINKIKNCWFAGTVEGYAYVGGIVGCVYQGSLTLDNCLLTGTVISTQRVGGLVGANNGPGVTYKTYLAIKNSISAGEIISQKETYAVGTVIGMPAAIGDVVIENVYSNEKRTHTSGTAFVASNTATGIGYLGAAGNVNGLPMELTDNLNGAKAYTNTELDFWSEDNEDGVWLAIEGSTPVLRVGADVNSAIQNLSGKRYSTGWYNNAYTCGAAKTMQLPDAATFELDSAADLNGFEVYCNNVTNFTGKTIKLTKDIHLNEGWVPSVNENGTLTNNTGLNQWSPIGKNGVVNTQFNGTFDGQGHSIHGVYVNATTRDAGFFGYTGTAAQIKNIRMYDSYINAPEQSFAGAIAGSFFGTLVENVYVDESVSVLGATAVAGICGAVFSGATRTISKCWFDGNVYSSNLILGGIVGYIYGGTNTISDCLVTGTITSTKDASSNASTGGLIGENITAGTKVIDCLSMGTICVNSKNQVNPVCGYTDQTDITYTNVYTTNEITFTADKTYTFNVTVGTLVSKDVIKANAKTALPGLYDSANETEKVWDLDTEGMPILNILQ